LEGVAASSVVHAVVFQRNGPVGACGDLGVGEFIVVVVVDGRAGEGGFGPDEFADGLFGGMF